MKTYIIVVVVLLLLVEGYGYVQNPAGCKKLVADLLVDVPPILTPTQATRDAFGNAVSSRGSSLVTWVTAGGSTNAASATPPDGGTNTATSVTPPTGGTNSSPAAGGTGSTASSPATNSLAPTSSLTPAPAPNSVTPVAAETLPAPTPAQQAALAAWTPPTSIPSQAGWTWTTPRAVYQDVQIVRVEADAVTIIHQSGGALVAMTDLPQDLRKQLNYNADAAAAAALKRAQDEAASQKDLASERGAGVSTAGNYQEALTMAKSSGKLVMLHFTGSDWCPYCKMLDSEVLATPSFGEFANPKYVFLTVDFPHNTPLPDAVKQENQGLAQKYGVQSYPTLVVIDTAEKEQGRVSGYDPGSGPVAVITQLKAFTR